MLRLPFGMSDKQSYRTLGLQTPRESLALTDEAAKRYLRAATPNNTRKAYAGDMRRFVAFCESHGLDALPASPETLVRYVTWLADDGRKVSTIKRAARLAGLQDRGFSGHSLRAGLATQAALNGHTVADIARQTGHRSLDTVLGYIRVATRFEGNVTAKIGL